MTPATAARRFRQHKTIQTCRVIPEPGGERDSRFWVGFPPTARRLKGKETDIAGKHRPLDDTEDSSLSGMDAQPDSSLKPPRLRGRYLALRPATIEKVFTDCVMDLKAVIVLGGIDRPHALGWAEGNMTQPPPKRLGEPLVLQAVTKAINHPDLEVVGRLSDAGSPLPRYRDVRHLRTFVTALAIVQ
jgi:hypothetical protein